jgi:lipopolysaccharide transport system permease protein
MGFINQVHYHHDALLIKQAAVQLANFLITFVLCVVILLCFGVVPSPMTLLLPVFLLPIFFLGSAIGLLVAPASSVSGDVSRAVSFMLGLVMYVTPIVYSSKVESKLLQAITAWNPLTYLVGGCRDAIVYGRIEHLGMYALMAVLSFVLFLLSWRIFYVTEMRVIEKMI